MSWLTNGHGRSRTLAGFEGVGPHVAPGVGESALTGWLDRFLHPRPRPMTSLLERPREDEHTDCCDNCPLGLGCSRGRSYCRDLEVDLRH